MIQKRRRRPDSFGIPEQCPTWVTIFVTRPDPTRDLG
jgi:hypothetical protein